jgi:hypothetical protein
MGIRIKPSRLLYSAAEIPGIQREKRRRKK